MVWTHFFFSVPEAVPSFSSSSSVSVLSPRHFLFLYTFHLKIDSTLNHEILLQNCCLAVGPVIIAYCPVRSPDSPTGSSDFKLVPNDSVKDQMVQTASQMFKSSVPKLLHLSILLYSSYRIIIQNIARMSPQAPKLSHRIHFLEKVVGYLEPETSSGT